MLIDRRKLITFFDDRPEVSRHAAAIKAVAGEELGLALLVEYLRRQGKNAEIVVDERGLPLACKPPGGGQKLDGWVKVTVERAVTFYQVEVKSWSSHSQGGRRLRDELEPALLPAFRQERWRQYWNGSCFKDKTLNKVLTRMMCPEATAHVEPLACLWDAVHHAGEPEPMFPVPISHGEFDRLWVFSMSTFLRSLEGPTVELDLPSVDQRLRLLDELFLRSPQA